MNNLLVLSRGLNLLANDSVSFALSSVSYEIVSENPKFRFPLVSFSRAPLVNQKILSYLHRTGSKRKKPRPNEPTLTELGREVTHINVIIVCTRSTKNFLNHIVSAARPARRW